MERRVLIAVILSFVVLYGYQALFVPAPAPKPPAEATPATPSTSKPVEAGQPPVVEAPSVNVLVGGEAERDIRLETTEVAAVFTSRGARIKSWRLKRYLDGNGNPLEVVATELADTQPLPFSLRFDDEALTRRLNTALFTVKDPPQSSSLDTAMPLIFEYQDSSGLHAVKEFRFEATEFTISVRTDVRQGDRVLQPAIDWGPAVGNGEIKTSSGTRVSGAIVYTGGEIHRVAATGIAEQPVFEGALQYAGVEDHYFITAVVAPGTARARFSRVTIPPPAGVDQPARDLVAWSIEGTPAGSMQRFFAGPKDFDVLASVDRDFVRAIDFGMFAFIVVPLLRTLNWINGFVGNYGWSIIVLTVIINALMFPLRHKSVVSMRKMQEIQPEMKAIQERYAKLKATDPAKQKMNQEVMALYRERGVNPASGCLPTLLTLPVLLAFYSLLSVSIELRGAPFLAWIHDLSRPDPYFILPVIVGVSQFWQTWLTPQTGVDPAQQRMMLIMPVVMVAFSLWLPSGVVLYWFVSTIWQIGQMYMTNYLIGPPNIRNIRPPAERRMKRAGAGKTEAAAREN
jgi:YidC/Oxa1 family membrane protein insertase